MALIESRPLADLQNLDRRLLHLFVAGAGKGEGLAIACPSRGWVFVDACATRRPKGNRPEYPLLEIYNRWSMEDDPVLAMVLTHPHEDHVEGFPRLIKRLTPQFLLITKPPSEEHAGPIFSKEATVWKQMYDSAREYETGRTPSLVANALQAIETWHVKNPGRVLGGCADYPLPFLPAGIEGWVRAPTIEDVTRLLGRVTTKDQYLNVANEISTVVELRFFTSRVVLGGDLPTRKQGREVPSGWSAVMARCPHLGQHVGLKVPHHASTEAMHPDLMPHGTSTRAWCITPFNSHKLPRPDPNHGLDFLLERAPGVLLSALPASRKTQAAWPHPGIIPLHEFHERTRLMATGQPYHDHGTDVTSSPAVAPLDPIWCCAFDDQGHVTGRWRGDAAVEVIRS